MEENKIPGIKIWRKQMSKKAIYGIYLDVALAFAKNDHIKECEKALKRMKKQLKQYKRRTK